ncbi:MAG: CBS domain-containing protein [Planctomycetota bacterium]|jgi:CBS domain-containing protein
MKVKEIMTANAETIDCNCTLAEAAAKMKALEIGALAVWRGDDVVGVITDRDITIRAVAKGRDPNKTLVNEIMTPDVLYCLENDDIREAAKIMERKSIHRLLVLNKDYEPSGFVSLSDFAVKSGDEHLTYEVLERVSSPACPNR